MQPTRPRKPRDKGKVEGAVLIVERWILARLRNMQFFSVEALNAAIAELLADLNDRPMRRIGRSRRDLFIEIERPALRDLPLEPFEYAEWKQAKVHPDYHIDVLHSFYSVPHRLIGKKVDIRLTHRMVEIFHNHDRVAVHTRRGTRGGHSTIREHMPKAHQRHGGMTPEYLITRAGRVGYHVAVLVERLMRDRPHPEQGYRSAIITAQLPVSGWHQMIGEPTIADAILDRIIHNAHRIELKGDSMRRKSVKPALTQTGNPEILTQDA